MNTTEAINLLETIKCCDIDELKKIEAINMAIEALREQDRINQFRIAPLAEYVERFCTPKQMAGYQHRKSNE